MTYVLLGKKIGIDAGTLQESGNPASLHHAAWLSL
jgi:hypothetical protein